MRIPRAIAMTVMDVGCLKWSAALFGMILGAYHSKFTKRHVWLFAIAIILLAIKPCLTVCRCMQCEPEEYEERTEP